MKFSDLLHKIIDLLLPPRCPYCGSVISSKEYACKDCIKQFPKEHIYKTTSKSYRCVAPFAYEGIFKKAVLSFKFGKQAGYSKQLAIPICNAIREAFSEAMPDVITAVPMHKADKKIRGFNQAELLAKECSKVLSIPYAELLEKPVRNKPQHTMNAKGRATNVRNVYKAKDTSAITDKKILIIDDIITTGNTLGVCCDILTKAGCREVVCATLCSAE